MTIVNNFEVQRFESCLRAALYENFISHYADKDDAEIITSDRDFIKRSNVKRETIQKARLHKISCSDILSLRRQ